MHPGTGAGHAWLARYQEAWWNWRRGDREDAAREFARAARLAREVDERYGLCPVYRRYADLCDALARAAWLDGEDRRELLMSLDDPHGYVISELTRGCRR